MSNRQVADGYRFDQASTIELWEETPAVVVVPEMQQDELDRLQAARFIGHIASQSVIETNAALAEAEPHTSLYEAMKTGNRDLVRANTDTNMIEIAFKAGFVMDVTLTEDENGHTHQHGQSTKSVQANNLMHGTTSGPMFERSKAETRNTFRLDSAKEQGYLEDYWFVTLSRTDSDMSVEELDEARFFTDTMSLSIQASTKKDGAITMESAFMAGVLEPGGERRDEDIVVAIGEAIGVDLSGLSATELLDMPLLIPKSLMPNGTVDLVRMGDQPYGTFFGQDKPIQDYAEYREACREHREMFAQKVDKVTDQLMSETATIKDEVVATQRLHELCGNEMVQQAIFDEWIDPGVFGPASAPHIMQARRNFAQGDHDAGLAAVEKAIETADPRSCAFVAGSKEDGKQGNTSDDDGECSFISKKCPECGTKNVLTIVTKTHIEGDCGCRVKKG